MLAPGAESRAPMVTGWEASSRRAQNTVGAKPLVTAPRTAPVSALALDERTPQDPLSQLRNRMLPKGRTPGPGVGSLQPSVKSCSWKPPSMLPRWPHAPASRRRLSSSEGASLVCGFPLGPVSGLLYLSLAWVNRSRPEQR